MNNLETILAAIKELGNARSQSFEMVDNDSGLTVRFSSHGQVAGKGRHARIPSARGLDLVSMLHRTIEPQMQLLLAGRAGAASLDAGKAAKEPVVTRCALTLARSILGKVTPDAS